MSSNINPNNIDTTYPIAGQDNDSQGFRDNFTNIKNNFQYAENEISDLQSKAILKAALTGTSILDNDMGGAPINNVKLNGAMTTNIPLDAASGLTVSGQVPIDYTAGGFTSFRLDVNSSLSFQNWPDNGNGSWVRVLVEVQAGDIGKTLTLPSTVSLGLSGIQGISPGTPGVSNTITFAAAGIFTFEFTTVNGGVDISIQDLNRPLNYYTNALTVNAPLLLNSSEDLAASGAASLTKTSSYFSTSAAETATLAAGTEGQTKVFAMYADGGNMVITVTNPGWGGAGTITFDTVGQSCILMYINSKWFCIGNNGAVFA